MTDKPDQKTAEQNAYNAAQFALAIERERKLELFRQGKLSDHEAELITRELCRVGDDVKAAKARQAEKEMSQLVAKMDGRR
jgi:hypothetical protein